MNQILDELIHDGTGQTARMPAALNPNFFQLDERSQLEMQRYARELSGMIRYFDFDGQHKGDWKAFLTDATGLVSEQDILKYQKDPTAFAHDLARLAWLSRPHYVLFLAFLDLLDRVRQDFNRFTERHLDYYYRDVLGFTLRKPEADSAYLLLENDKQTREYRLPKGTLLKAGKDVGGKNRNFSTNEEIIVNNTQIGELRTVVMDSQRLSLKEYYDTLGADNKHLSLGEYFDELFKNGTKSPILGIFNLVYGDNLISFLTPTGDIFQESSVAYVKKLFDYIISELFLPLSEFRKLLNLKTRLTNAVMSKWNTILIAAAAKKGIPFPPPILRDNRDFMNTFQDIYQFDPLNLAKDLNNPFQTKFQGVEDIFDLAEQIDEQIKLPKDKFDAAKMEQFRKFIHEDLAMPVVFSQTDKGVVFETDFRKMMNQLTIIKSDWAKVNRIIKKAGKAKRKAEYNPDWINLPFFSTEPIKSFPDIESRLRAALTLGDPLFDFTFQVRNSTTIVKLKTIPEIEVQLTQIQDWFQLAYEDVAVLLNTKLDTPQNQSIVFKLLEKAWYKRQDDMNTILANNALAAHVPVCMGFRTLSLSGISLL